MSQRRYGVATEVGYRAYNTLTGASLAESVTLHTVTLRRDGVDVVATGTKTSLGNGRYVLALSAADMTIGDIDIRGVSSTTGVELYFSPSPIQTIKLPNVAPGDNGGMVVMAEQSYVDEFGFNAVLALPKNMARLFRRISTAVAGHPGPAVEPGEVGGLALATANGVLTAGQQGQLDSIETDADLIPAVKAKTDLIGTGNITWTSPGDEDGDVTVRRDRDYSNDDGLAVEWTNADGTWPDLTDATIAILVAVPGVQRALHSFDGSVVTPTGANQKVRLELTATQLAIASNDYVCEIVATLATGRKTTLTEGSFEVLLGREEPA